MQYAVGQVWPIDVSRDLTVTKELTEDGAVERRKRFGVSIKQRYLVCEKVPTKRSFDADR